MIKQTYIINSPIEEVWLALTDPKYIDAWGGGPSKMEGKAGTSFSLWDGEIYGENKEVIEYKKLVQEWWSESDKWDSPTTATFELFGEDSLPAGRQGKTRLEFTHIDVPQKSVKDIEDGWKNFYLGPLKKYLEEKK